jgi:uncharacterized protein (TIGR03435 family)
MARHRSIIGTKAVAIGAAICVSVFVLGSQHLYAQLYESVSLPSYEVTSVKATANGDPNRNITWDETPNGLMVTNVTPELLIRQAYGLKSYQIERGPEWIKQKTFDVFARIGDGESSRLQTLNKEDARAERRLMLQALLADRFRLAVHDETKEGSVYELLVAKGGPKFKQTAEETPVTDGVAPANSTVASYHPPIVMENGLLAFNGAPIAALANFISQLIGRPVLDRTGLVGKYEFTLKWTLDEFDLSAVSRQGDDTSSEPTGTSILTVIQEQLGLRLKSAKGPVQTLVIDHIEEPSAN